jgi:hypothetical protein
MVTHALATKSLEFFAKNPVDRIGAAATDGDARVGPKRVSRSPLFVASVFSLSS